MNLLAFDTSSNACSVALLRHDHLVSLHRVAPMQQASLILPLIDELLGEAKLTLEQLDAIGFGCGPGSFTGIRIASSVAQGLNFAYAIPLVPISSLAATAQAAFDTYQLPHLLVALDARMEQVYWACYKADEKGLVTLVGQEKVCSPQDANVLEMKEDWSGVGDGWGQYQEKLSLSLTIPPKVIKPEQTATAAAVLKLAKAQLERGVRGINASEVAPVYLR